MPEFDGMDAATVERRYREAMVQITDIMLNGDEALRRMNEDFATISGGPDA